MLIVAALFSIGWIVPARELAELSSREAPLQWPAEPYLLRTGSMEGSSDELFRCERDSVLCRLRLSPPEGSLTVYGPQADIPLRTIPIEALFLPAERFSNTHPASLGKPLVFKAGERVVWKHAGSKSAHYALREWPAGAPAIAEASAGQLARARELFSAPPELPDGTLCFQYSLSENDPAGTLMCVDDKRARGPACVSSIVLRVDGPDAEENVKFLFVRLRFDGEETVVAPLRALFRSVELDPRMRARSGRDFALRWKMPYREKLDFLIENLGPPTTHVSGALYTSPWNWDERSLHFAAIWLPAKAPARLTIEGQGALLGIAPAVATREAFLLRATADERALELYSGIALLDRLLFRERLTLELEPLGQTLALLGVRPGAKLPLREARPEDWESLSREP
jgi:hypothetical protein